MLVSTLCLKIAPQRHSSSLLSAVDFLPVDISIPKVRLSEENFVHIGDSFMKEGNNLLFHALCSPLLVTEPGSHLITKGHRDFFLKNWKGRQS